MKKTSAAGCLLGFVIVLTTLAGCQNVMPAIKVYPGPQSCTIFAASYGNTVLFGNNEDYINLDTHYWVIPASEGKYGVFCLGFDDLRPQGGINEKGLCFDGNALPAAPLNLHPELPKPPDSLIQLVMKTCATVEEVISLIKSYSWAEAINCQIFFADATGDMVVVSAAPDGEWAFTRPNSKEGCLVSTNFNVANKDNGHYPCARYNAATELLQKFRGERDVTIANFRAILDASHQEGVPYGTDMVNTVYSNIIDPTKGTIYMYYHHQFNEAVKLNLFEELSKENKGTPIKDLFSKKTVDKAMAEYEAYQKDPTLYLERILNKDSDASVTISAGSFWLNNWWLTLGAVVGVAIMSGAGFVIYRKVRRSKVNTGSVGG